MGTERPSEKPTELSAHDLLAAVYEKLTLRLEGREVAFTKRKPHPEIADDSDYHRTRKGHMSYDAVRVARIGDQAWALGFGTAWGSYPADPYDCDILAVQLPTAEPSADEEEAIYRAVSDADYFRSSLVYAMADGRLAVNRSGMFKDRVLHALQGSSGQFLARDMKVNPDFLHTDGRPLVSSAAAYKPEFVDTLAEKLHAVLTDFKP